MGPYLQFDEFGIPNVLCFSLFHSNKIKTFTDTDMMENHGLIFYFVINANKLLRLCLQHSTFIKCVEGHAVVSSVKVLPLQTNLLMLLKVLYASGLWR